MLTSEVATGKAKDAEYLWRQERVSRWGAVAEDGHT